MTPIIRHATLADAPALAELAGRTFRDAFGADTTPEDMALHLASSYRPELQAREIADPAMITLVVEDAGALVAQALMARAFEVARAAGFATIWLGVWERNPRAIAFYRKCGYVDVGQQTFVLGTDHQTDRVLCRPLAFNGGSRHKIAVK